MRSLFFILVRHIANIRTILGVSHCCKPTQCDVSQIFKHRESHDPKSFCATRANGLVEMVINALHEKCRIVNQVGKSYVKGYFKMMNLIRIANDRKVIFETLYGG